MDSPALGIPFSLAQLLRPFIGSFLNPPFRIVGPMKYSFATCLAFVPVFCPRLFAPRDQTFHEEQVTSSGPTLDQSMLG